MGAININGIELEIDMMDADVMEKYEHLTEKLTKEISESKQYVGLSNSDGIRIQCHHIGGFFDALFGSGTAKRVFRGSNNLGLYIDAFAQVTYLAINTKEEIYSIADKYGLGRLQNRQQSGGLNPQNRAQRRAVNKNKGKYHR